MGKIRVGHKLNSFLNGEWAHHANGYWCKRLTSKRRRKQQKKIINRRLEEI